MTRRSYSANEERELQVIQLFRLAYADFPRGKLIKSESPDFILKINTKYSVGLELTHLDDFGKKNAIHVPDNCNISELSQANNSIASISPEVVKKTLQRKELKLDLYQKNRLNQYWLIIQAGEMNSTIHYRISQDLFHMPLKTKFDKVFLFIINNVLVKEICIQ